MNGAEALVLGEVTGVLICGDCLVLWGPLPWGLGLRHPRLPRFRRHFWLYPRNLRERGIA